MNIEPLVIRRPSFSAPCLSR